MPLSRGTCASVALACSIVGCDGQRRDGSHRGGVRCCCEGCCACRRQGCRAGGTDRAFVRRRQRPRTSVVRERSVRQGGSGHEPGGKKVKTVAAVGGIDEVTVPRGSKFAYAASATHGRILQIDLATLAVVRNVKLPFAGCPESLAAVSATLVAFAYGCNQQWAGIGVLDLGTGKIQVEPSPKLVAAACAGDSRWQAVRRRRTRGRRASCRLRRLDRRSGRRSRDPLRARRLPGDAGPHRQSRRLEASCCLRCQRQVARVFTGDAEAGRDVQSQPQVTAAAYSPDGAHVASGSEGMYNVSLFRRSTHSLAYIYSYSYSFLPDQFTPTGGVAFSSDGAKLYTLKEDHSRSQRRTHLMTFPAHSVPYIAPPDRSTLSLKAPARVKVNVDFTASGVLSFGSGVIPLSQDGVRTDRPGRADAISISVHRTHGLLFDRHQRHQTREGGGLRPVPR